MAARSEPLVSILIPCRNEEACIMRCVQSALLQDLNGLRHEVLVVDGMSTDHTRQLLDEMKAANAHSHVQLHVLDNPALVVSAGLNKAIRAARGDILVRMDAHTEYASDYVFESVAVLKKTAADNAGGPARTKAEGYLPEAIAAAYHSPFSVGGARFHDVNYEGWVDTVTYGCWPRRTFERFGLFDEELVRNQDDEHNLRIVRGGGKIYQSPSIKSWYKPRGSVSALFKQYMQYGYWKVRIIQKHKLPASCRHLVPGAFVLALTVLFLLSAFSFLFSTLMPASDPWPLVSRLSPLATNLWPLASVLLGGLLTLYLVADLVASFLTAAKTEWKLFPLLPFVFPCYHFGYGYGFLRGVWDFVICKKRPRPRFQTLTR